MSDKRVKGILIALLAVVVVLGSFPALAEEEQSVMFRSMVQTMMGQGLGEDVANRIANNTRFMVQMCVDQVEKDQLQTRDQLQTKDQLQIRDSVSERVGSAFGLALAASYRNQGEEKTFQTGMAVFSSIRRGLSPEGAAYSVEVLAENDYEVEQMYRVMMRLTEQLRNSVNCDEESLMTQLRTMAQARLSVGAMEDKIAEQARSGNGAGQSGSPENAPQAGKNQGQGNSGSSEGAQGKGK